MKIMMYDGIGHCLNEVRYVLALRKNIISLGSLDMEDYSYKARERKLLLTKFLVAITRWEIQPKNVCLLLKGTITSGAENSTQKDSEYCKIQLGVFCTKEKWARNHTIKENFNTMRLPVCSTQFRQERLVKIGFWLIIHYQGWLISKV